MGSACKYLLVDGRPVSFGKSACKFFLVYARPVSFGRKLASAYWLIGAQLVSGECLEMFIG